MSHFTVLAIVPPGKSLEAHLQPFHEFECTGEADQYVIDVDKTEEVRAQIASAKQDNPSLSDTEALAEGLDWYGLADSQVADESEADRAEEHKFGFAVVKDDQLVKAVDRTNPNKKWDWWTVGGRWRGMLRLHDGQEADQSVASVVDWDGMVAAAAGKAGIHWDKVTAAIGGRSFTRWADLLTKVKASELTIDHAREEYNAQPVVIDTKSLVGWFDGAEQLAEIAAMSREDYAAFKGKENARTFALLDADGNWIEPGSMGWFGMSSDTPESRREFTDKFWEYVRTVPADHTVAVVDCHI